MTSAVVETKTAIKERQFFPVVERVPLASLSQRHISTPLKTRTWTSEGDELAYFKTPYLTRIGWKDGSFVYCRRCDAEVAMRAIDGMLVDAEGHKTHPANVVISKGAE